ncbi:MAG: hypothetical protein CMB20_004650 [Methanobacteriota archaeon]|nr:MAG: hypothetical protein CMB20_004650 [Euryarchaeota archaeon]|tara:strand:- start:5603 stop:6697 length:1095 start_codon:yes stop_codon:yes gene_type:complete
MSLLEIFQSKRKKYEKDEKSDGSDVEETDSDSHLEDSEDETRKYRPGGYFNPEGKNILKDSRGKKWTLGEKIGRGHFSTVYSCADADSVQYAMKIQKSAKSYRVAAREEILIHEFLSKSNKEGKTHVCIMNFNFSYNHNTSGKHFCMVFPKMRYDLDKYAQKFEENKIDLEKTSKIAFQVLSGLNFLHKTGFLHADLKPENILVSEEDIFSISDLGTAAVIGDRDYSYIQTSHYRSPEIIMGHRQWDEKIDIWSMGCIVYECITGSYLFKGECEEDYITAFIETIGIPNYSFIEECKNRRDFFNRDNRFRNACDLEPLSIDRILQEKYDFNRDTANAIFALIQPMLIWDLERRWSAESLLQLYK